MFDALTRGHLKAHYGENHVIDWPHWQRSRHFKVCLDLSMAKAPPNESAMRRASVLIPRAAFNEWLKSVVPIEESQLATTPLKQRCRAFVRRHIESGRIYRKPELRALALAAIPRLSARTFNAVWEELAPLAWKQPGRKPATA